MDTYTAGHFCPSFEVRSRFRGAEISQIYDSRTSEHRMRP